MNATEDETLIAQLIRDEGMRLYAYMDSRGYWTIGVGRLIDQRAGGRITHAEAEMFLQNDIKSCEEDLDRRLTWWRKLSEPRQRVLLNMCFNLGIQGLLGFKRTLTAIRAGEYDKAAEYMLESRWAQQVGKRAHRLAEQMRTGKDVN